MMILASSLLLLYHIINKIEIEVDLLGCLPTISRNKSSICSVRYFNNCGMRKCLCSLPSSFGQGRWGTTRRVLTESHRIYHQTYFGRPKNWGLVKFDFKFGAHENSSLQHLEHIIIGKGPEIAQLLLELVSYTMPGNSSNCGTSVVPMKLILKLTAILT